MHQEPLPTKVTLPLVPCNDPELTCFVCIGKRTCELMIEIRRPGLTRWYGIHVECVAVAEKARGLKPKAEHRYTCGHSADEHEQMILDTHSMVPSCVASKK